MPHEPWGFAQALYLLNRVIRMSQPPDYVVVTPVRDEQDWFGSTVESFASQTLRPARWIIVDDGSTDSTGDIADRAARLYNWITVVHRTNRGFRKAGGGVVDAFYDGFRAIGNQRWDFVCKIDGDLTFSPEFFESALQRFAADATLGIGGGLICRGQGGTLVTESSGDPPFHVRGATKIYRRQCWEQIGGLVAEAGWDTIDELKANMLGWTTRTFEELKIHQLKSTGSADGSWRNWVKNGRANYAAGYHPVFMMCKCVKRITQRPFGTASLGLLVGFLGSYCRRIPRSVEPELVEFVRREQMRKLLLRRSLWTARPTVLN